ncbi:MAG: VPGUxxT family thioredoxin-like (seleno)protein, type 2 [Myxococcota bacterium]
MRLMFALMTLSSVVQTPPELGTVAWQRDYDAARREAARSGKPLLILFDEVPGCSTCVRYGQSVLSHPLIADAIEASFVPVAVYNNRGGADRQVLQSFGEPTWNNPVVRIVDAEGQALAPRLANDYQRRSLVERMERALTKLGRPVPSYLREALDERTELATYAMGCFWSGEACLGNIQGVRSSRTGFAAGREVVELRYDPQTISALQLHRTVLAHGCSRHALVQNEEEARVARQVFSRVTVSGSLRPTPSDDKHALRRTPARFLPLTEGQATRVNARIAAGQGFDELLSPSQQAVWAAIRQHPDAGWKPAGTELSASMRAARDVADRL